MKEKFENTHLYDDIIELSYRQSPRRKPMPVQERAAQFAPFAALTGYHALLRDTAEEREQTMQENKKE